MKPGLQLRVSQQLALTPQLQQAIRLLQLSQLELETELRQLVESNPMLEFAEDAEPSPEAESEDSGEDFEFGNTTESTSADSTDSNDWETAEPMSERDLDLAVGMGSSYGGDGDETFEPQNAAPEGLREHLTWQVNVSSLSRRQQLIALAIVDALNDDGYLHDGVEPVLAALPDELHIDADEVEAVRRLLQAFDPSGVASLDLRDCLLAQIDQLDPDVPHLDLARHIVDSELALLARNDIDKLARRFHADPQAVAEAAALIRTLDPRPGAALDPTPVEYVVPDAYAWREGNQWRVGLSPNAQPRLGLNQHYCNLISRARREDASYLRGQLQEARWLLKSLQSRADTVQKVAEAIVRRQTPFLDYGPEAMRPMVLREVAEEVGMHESTISRVTTRKYLRTPRGIFEFKYFFSSGVSTDDGGSASATAIQAMLRKLVDEEDPRRPLSDQALADQFNRRGIRVARRTVAKYREVLRIPSSSERQRRG
jgi:RNA polymerase sigma-54 factor